MATNEENDRQKIGLRLKEARDFLGLSQDEVAKALKMPRPAVSLIESGERKVEALELKRFAELFQRPLDFFLADKHSSDDEVKAPAHLQRAPREIAQLAKTANKLSTEDRTELMRFAEFLRSKPKPK
jgi:transcriptional regulator with XRE-family HTH domain